MYIHLGQLETGDGHCGGSGGLSGGERRQRRCMRAGGRGASRKEARSSQPPSTPATHTAFTPARSPLVHCAHSLSHSLLSLLLPVAAMASQGAPAAAAGVTPAPQTGSPQQLNQIVMEYLSKKGYSKTEAMLRLESQNTDAEGRPIIADTDDDPKVRYEKAYSKIAWQT